MTIDRDAVHVVLVAAIMAMVRATGKFKPTLDDGKDRCFDGDAKRRAVTERTTRRSQRMTVTAKRMVVTARTTVDGKDDARRDGVLADRPAQQRR